jgi:hypothetical protein
LSKTGQNDVFVKVETEAEENERFQQQHHQDKSAQQDISSLNEYLSRFSGPPTFPFQQMYKYPTELIHVTQTDDQQQNMMNDNSPSVQTPEQQQSQVIDNVTRSQLTTHHFSHSTFADPQESQKEEKET